MIKAFFIAILFIILPASAWAQSTMDKAELRDAPVSLEELLALKKENKSKGDKEESLLPLDIRLDGIKEAAMSYGARGGLTFRTWHIRREMEGRARYLDKVFDFRQLLVPAPSGLLIEPPVISEAMDAMIIDQRGIEAAVSDRVLNINQNARIVSAPRSWRVYLERDWTSVDPPPDILRPNDKEERKIWEEFVRKGWEMGIEQADQIFQADLNRLTADYQGMVRYRQLLSQGMVSPPYALQVDRGVTGGGDEMRIGDRALSLTELPKLQTRSEEWQPANR